MSALEDLPNIGKVLAGELRNALIPDPETLRNMGTEKTFIRLNCLDKNSCLSKLYAIEGAVQGIRWHKIEALRKQELKMFYYQLKR